MPFRQIHRSQALLDGTPQPQPMLDSYIDMTTLGHSDRNQVPEMAVTIIAPTLLEPSRRHIQAREALAYMAQQFGFIDTTPATF
jgi:hypothetical protein